jgi:hypothetical protein
MDIRLRACAQYSLLVLTYPVNTSSEYSRVSQDVSEKFST